jgi:hypothetical protein
MASDADADAPCFDGLPVSADACLAEPAASTQPQKQRQRRKGSSKQQATDPLSSLLSRLPWKLKRRQIRQLSLVAELVIGTAMSGLMAWVVVLLLQRIMQVRRLPVLLADSQAYISKNVTDVAVAQV